MEQTKTNKSLTDILTNTETNVSPVERFVSATAGGALLAYGLRSGGALGVLLSVLGGSLAFRGATGHCHLYDAMDINTNDQSADKTSGRSAAGKQSGWLSGKVEVKKAVTINKSPAELYKFWRDFENLPQFMNHLESVTNLDGNRSHWKAKAPLGTSVEWDAEVTDERENDLIAWNSLEGADVPNSGIVQFLPTANRGTEVKVAFTYEVPGGYIGSLMAKLFGEEPNQQVDEDLKRFKKLMETGTIITTEGQPSGRAPEAKKATA